MSVSRKTFLFWWLGGLSIFAVSIVLHAPLAIDAVPAGILDHQAAPDAARVDAVQGAWRAAGLLGQARVAMVCDLVFIGVYGTGGVLAGLRYRGSESRALSGLGWVILASAVTFLITDYLETLAQLTQLMRFSGNDFLAGLASSLGSVKVLSFLATLFVPALALFVERATRAPL
ncbi:MAG: hypothetical protein QNI87_05430 [Erythrobacter sp.]|uniref:hypothetical protein n=1 Tax=Erythrobacter sp. TaxID=1042 RepID=UPI0026346EDB|nr:hypothetical protein [Erythrobacter sp.]MDJ0977959.1 hypothetical protein [Erythrobacter sp.]